ncbi:monocopper oxidase-like protein SKS1 [Heracleum sosnowskyi]|uniref:Monocopper oxidase-like protein SKS1 n=1 Tax=Heracleum sosnowskyi TaxID=360622 RepID=A0AAD8M629_9APIA|nr:monocopper oxidase-like protein SKS1 [Heracleum sosnowskyi]
MALIRYSVALFFLQICLAFAVSSSEDGAASFDLDVSYITASPLGVPQQVIAVNGKFPGPIINVTTNYNVTLNVNNGLNENLLMTWPGVHMRHTSWQDGVLGTNCPIQSGSNWTYNFQVKDQIGSFFYFPSLNFQRASGGFGAFIITHRSVVKLPFRDPDGDIVIMIGDWYNRDHKALRADLDSGKELGIPDGVLINGKGPYRYNSTLVPKGISYETINVEPGRTYRVHVHNVGISTCLNFRIQNHKLLLVETEGFYVMQRTYTKLDIHVGQSYSFLVTMDQNAKNDYYIVASARFVNQSLWQRVTGVAILHYSKSNQKASGPLPDPPNDAFDKSFVVNQALSIRQDVSANGARPNPQGSFHYGSIKVTDVYILKSRPLVMINGKLRATLNEISFINPGVPIRLADKFHVKEAYNLDFPSRPQSRSPQMHTSLLNATFKGFVEIILVNNDTTVQSFHLDGYSFFVVGMAYGEWTPYSRNSYNKWDAIFRCTTQVFPGGWTAILVYLDNVGAWNLRAANLDRWYLGQETYMRVVNPEPDPRNKTEVPTPDNVLYCGALNYLQKPRKTSFTSAKSSSNGRSKLSVLLLPAFSAVIAGIL